MKIFKLWQDLDTGYLAVTSCVIIAESEARAREVSAKEFGIDWRTPEHVYCKEIGIATPGISEEVVIYECIDG